MNRYRLAIRRTAACFAVLTSVSLAQPHGDPKPPLRVFIFAGQSNMEGAQSPAAEIDRFPHFEGLLGEVRDVPFHHCIGRESKNLSDGWTSLAPVGDLTGPELSFARIVEDNIKDPIAIIKIAAGGTTLATDWDPDEPEGFNLYPVALKEVRAALGALDKERTRYILEGFVWHQGENDMLDSGLRPHYAKNLTRFIARWREDLERPELPFFIGGHCTNTIWGMDHRSPMHTTDRAQRAVADADAHATFVPTQHLAVQLGDDTGLHYHYGTLGQLQHGETYGRAYLRSVEKEPLRSRPLKRWPLPPGKAVTLFILAGHRNMEGEGAFAADLKGAGGRARFLSKDDWRTPLRVHLGRGFCVSEDWEPMGPAGPFGTFGPELSFAEQIKRAKAGPFAVAKFTVGGSQLADWLPTPDDCPDRNLHGEFIAFVQDAIRDLESAGTGSRSAPFSTTSARMTWPGTRPAPRQPSVWAH